MVRDADCSRNAMRHMLADLRRHPRAVHPACCPFGRHGEAYMHRPAPLQVLDPAALHPEDFLEAQRAAAAAEEQRRAAQRQATGRIDFVKSASQPNLGAARQSTEDALAAAQARAAAVAARVAAMDPQYAASRR